MTTIHGRFVRIAVMLPLYFVTMVLLHEAGHAVTAAHATSGIVRIYIWPGYELYPDFGFAASEPWPADRAPSYTLVTPVARASAANGNLSFPPLSLSRREYFELRRHESLIKLMGSATTLLFALVSLALISLCKPKGLALALLVAGSLLHLDMLTYTVLPVFFGVRHLIWIGGTLPEPVEALSGLGLPEGASLTAIILLSLLQLAWLYYLLRIKLRRPAQSC